MLIGDNLDKILTKAMEETVSFYGCQHCGMCYKIDSPTLSKKDIKK